MLRPLPVTFHSMPRWVVVGNPENRRVALFQRALEQCGCPPATVIAYEAWLAGRQSLDQHLDARAVVRIESPGENFAVEKALLAVGAAEAEAEGSPYLTPKQLVHLAFDRGLIVCSRQWYLGFCRVLRRLQRSFQQVPGLGWMNWPADIEVMFDKVRCHAACCDAGIPVPETLGPVGSYEELVSRMDRMGLRRVFVKPAHGSSASGVVALIRGGERQEAITSAELVQSGGRLRLYNSLRIRRYTDPEEVRQLIDALCRDRVHVERWLPKASLGRETFDLRVMVIGGAVRHIVVRQSRTPITNLHLGNRRGDLEILLDRLSPQGWGAVERTCRRAAALFSRSLYVAVDVLLTPGFRQHAVLEINAFGDLLPGVLHGGLDTYSAEVTSLLAQRAAGTIAGGRRYGND